MAYLIATVVMIRVSLKVISLLNTFSSAIFRIYGVSHGPSAFAEFLFA